VNPARVARVDDEPAVAGGYEPGVDLLERGLGNHGTILGGSVRAARGEAVGSYYLRNEELSCLST
jgi:hypothetical protein